MVYTPTGEPFTVDTSGIKGKKIKATWLNPLNGDESSIEAPVGKGPVDFEPPAADNRADWTLVLEVDGKKCGR